MHDLLLSSAFEDSAVCWDLVTRNELFKLKGHTKPITGMQLVLLERNERVITVDVTGVFKARLLRLLAAPRSPLQPPRRLAARLLPSPARTPGMLRRCGISSQASTAAYLPCTPSLASHPRHSVQ